MQSVNQSQIQSVIQSASQSEIHSKSTVLSVNQSVGQSVSQPVTYCTCSGHTSDYVPPDNNSQPRVDHRQFGGCSGEGRRHDEFGWWWKYASKRCKKNEMKMLSRLSCLSVRLYAVKHQQCEVGQRCHHKVNVVPNIKKCGDDQASTSILCLL